MARKKESETLRQRKFAQQEFLKLKKMQQGELDAGPKPSELAKPLTFGEKLKNIWYHDKFALSVIAIIIVAIVFLCVQCATKTVYDATVVVFTHKITGEPNCKKMGEYLAEFCPDLNDDGEINVNVINCSINPNDKSDYSYTNRSKAQSLLATDASALLFITDDDSYEYLMGLSKEIPLFEGEPLEFGEEFYEFCADASDFYDTPDGLQISCRTIKGSAIEDDNDVDKHYKQAQAILKGLKKENGQTTDNTKVVYDTTVVVYTHKIIDDSICKKMSEYLAEFCPDLNDDGEININVINCSINPDDKGDHSYTNREKAIYLLANDASALLFITDDSSYQFLMSRSDNIDVFEGEPLEFGEDFYEFCADASDFYDTPDGLQISCRTIKGSSIEDENDVDKHYKQAQAILKGLKKDYGKTTDNTKIVCDATVVVYTHKIIDDSSCEKISEYLTPYCPDLNDDGEINVNVINCSINPNDKSDYSYTIRSKVQFLLATDASALLFITDADSYKYLMGLSKEITVFESEPFEFGEEFYNFCVDESGFYVTPDGLQISCRTIKGTAIEEDKNVKKYYDQAQAILNELKNK